MMEFEASRIKQGLLYIKHKHNVEDNVERALFKKICLGISLLKSATYLGKHLGEHRLLFPT